MCRVLAAICPRPQTAGQDDDENGKDAVERELRAYSSTIMWLTRESPAVHQCQLG
jgi:hypothetical protein